MCLERPRESGPGTAGPAGWSQARLCWGCGPVACGRPDYPPGSLLHWPHPTPDWGSTSHPTPQLWGDFQGLLCSFSHSPPPLPVSLTEGAFCLFFSNVGFFCVSCPLVFKDAAGQMGGEGVCLPSRLRGLRRGSLGRAETSCNTVLPGQWPEDACNSRGQVTPSTLASAPPSALPLLCRTPHLPHPFLVLVLF